MKYTRGALGIQDRHNERKNSDYRNQDIIAERSDLNVHFKHCGTTYTQAFDKLLADGVISTRYLGKDPNIVDELIFDVNTEYFERRGGYEFAKDFYTEAYNLAVKNDIETANRHAKAADNDKDFYNSRLKALSEDTEIFQEAVNIAPREVIKFLNLVIDYNRQQETQRQQQADRDDYDYSL